MSHWRMFGVAIFAAAGLLGGATGSVRAACSGTCAVEWNSGGKITNLGGLPGPGRSEAVGINNAGQVVGDSFVGGTNIPTEWSGGKVIDMGLLPGSSGGSLLSINDAGQAV